MISSINKKINSRMSLADLLASIMDVAAELLNAEGSSLLLSDKVTGDLVFNVVIGYKGDIIKGEKVPKGKGIAGTVAETHQPVIVDDAQKDPRFFGEIDRKSSFKTRNIIALPMLVMGEFVGVLEVVNTIGRDSFDNWDLEKAQYIADQAAVAINNRQLYDDLAKRIEEITSLYEVAQSISFAAKDDDIFYNIISSLARSMNVEKASIILFDKEENKMRLEAAIGLPESMTRNRVIDIDETISGHVYRTGNPMIVTNIMNELPGHFQPADRDYKTNSFISIPITHEKKTIGILSLADRKNMKHFDSFDLSILSTVSSQIAELYQNIQNRKNEEKQKRLALEIDIAAEIQRKNLPRVPSRFKDHSLAVFNRPAKEVGGDFFDFFGFDSNKCGVLVADVSGKGIPAALFMGIARNIVRAETRIDRSPAHMLQNANAMIRRDSESGMFVTLFYAVIDTHNNLITYGNAGHNAQMLVKRKTGEAVLLSAKGTVLGLLENQEYEEKVTVYERGDVLVLFTDGVLECLGGESLDIDSGEKELMSIVLNQIDLEPNELIAFIKNILDSKALDEDFRDDITIFVIKF